LTIKKELMTMKKEITAIGKKLEQLITALEKSEKSTHTKASKPKAVKAKSVKKPEKTPAKKKAVKVTATDQVLKIINRSKKGVDTATLIKKTGFDQKKVRNILQRTFKQGKITRVGKGIYVGAK
jgi:hypothetical protein